MLTDSLTDNDTGSTSLPDDVTDGSYTTQCIEIVPLTRDTDGPCTTERDSGDWSAEVKQEDLPVVKQEPDDDDDVSDAWKPLYLLQVFFSNSYICIAHILKMFVFFPSLSYFV